MRLIHCREMRMVEFSGEDIPQYAILSHTWGKEEVTYQDFGTEEAKSRAGWDKIQQTCETALHDWIDYAWVDTCCIDKSSSAELAEAINSMFQWYARSRICYVFLEDCVGKLDRDQLASSRWISRGWTLQELIAPKSIIFFNRHWDHVGTKKDLSKSLYNITGIPIRALDPSRLAKTMELLPGLPVYQKMSWASGRKTTRVEDAAYCLMGLFGVNMPLLYGEGHKAFTRLQEEIMRHVNDMSIFAWENEDAANKYGTKADMGLLAQSPDAFANLDFEFAHVNLFGPEFSLTNRGIRISAGNVWTNDKRDDFVLCLSDSSLRTGDRREILGVAIRPIGGGLFVRSQREVQLMEYSRRDRSISSTADLYLVTELPRVVFSAKYHIYSGPIHVPQLEEVKLSRTGVFPQLQFQHASNRFITNGYNPPIGCATYKCLRGRNPEDRWHIDEMVIFFGLDDHSNPWCRVSSPDHYPGWSNQWWAQEDNLKRYSSVAYRERKLDWEVAISDALTESIRSAIVIRSRFHIRGEGWDLKLSFEEAFRLVDAKG